MLCATDGISRKQDILGRLYDYLNNTKRIRRTSPQRICTVATTGRYHKKESYGPNKNMIWHDQGRSLGYRVNNLTQVDQLTILVGDLLIQLNRSTLIPATTTVTEHSTQSSSALSQPNLAFFNAACEASIPFPHKSAIAVAEDVVQVQIRLMLGSIGTSAESLECHGVVVKRDVARCFAEVASSRGLEPTTVTGV